MLGAWRGYLCFFTTDVNGSWVPFTYINSNQGICFCLWVAGRTIDHGAIHSGLKKSGVYPNLDSPRLDMKRISCFALMFIFFSILGSCGDKKTGSSGGNPEGSGSNTTGGEPLGPFALSGVSQKGPFAIGSSVSVQTLQKDMAPTGEVYLGSTSDDLGTFKILKEIKNRFVEVVIEGYFFDEISGSLSNGTLTLRSVSDLSEGPIKVNLLTSLQAQRIKNLVQAGKTFADARKQSKSEILDALNIPRDMVSEEFDKLDISNSGNGNAVLLAVSSVFLQAAYDNSNASTNKAADLSTIVSTFITDFGTDGIINSASIKSKLLAANSKLKMADIREKLRNRFQELGAAASIPAFEDFIDSDADGKINKIDSESYVGAKFYELVSTPAGRTQNDTGLGHAGSFYWFPGAYPATKAYRFDEASKTWSALADMNVSHDRPAVVSHDGKIYVIGGGYNGGGSGKSTIEVYDAQSNSWLQKSSIPNVPCGYPEGAVSVGADIFVVWGAGACGDGNGGLSNVINVLRYSPSGDFWTSVTSLPKCIKDMGVFSNGQSIYLFGGMGTQIGNDASCTYEAYDGKTTFKYSVSENVWSEIQGPSARKIRPAYGLVGSKIWVIGSDNGGSDGSVVSFDLPTETWTKHPLQLINSSLHYVTGGSLGNKIFYTGNVNVDPKLRAFEPPSN